MDWRSDACYPLLKFVPEEADKIIQKHLEKAFEEIRETFLPRIYK